MVTHVKVLGILHIIFGALGILVALGLLMLFGGLAGVIGASAETGRDDRAAAMGVLSIIGVVVFFVILVLSLPGLIAGIGLLKFRPWGRILGIVVSALDLIHVPLGTALGVYGLWVLLSNETEALFRDPAAYMAYPPPGPVGPVGPVA
jgi:hypothetical protein